MVERSTKPQLLLAKRQLNEAYKLVQDASEQVPRDGNAAERLAGILYGIEAEGEWIDWLLASVSFRAWRVSEPP